MIPTKEEDEDEATNLVPVLYASGATIPNGSDVEYWMEGVTPGKITLVFHYTKGATDFKHEQEFLVCTQQNKEDWQREIGKQILLETNGAVNMGGLVPTNEFTANIPYLKAVYGYYEQLFVLYPDQFIWAGMAKMAGAPVYAGLSDAQVLRTAGGILGPLLQLLTNLGVTAQIQEFQTQLMAGNKLIFDDLAWQHRAYVASGIWALEYVDEKDKTSSSRLRKVGIRDWQQIDEAIQKGESLSASLLDGNKKLLKREQEFIIQDVYDHIIQANDLSENYRDMMMNMQDLYLSNVNLRMNEVMKVMAVVTCLLAPATVIGGIFGMNFDIIPLMHNTWGFFISVGLMLIIPIIMIRFFRKRGWF